MDEKVSVCELCKDKPAAVLCSECCMSYCDECSEYVHRKSPKKGHKVEAIPEGVAVDARCSVHDNNAFKIFCVDEVKLCCSACQLKRLHKGHTAVELSEISQDNEVFSAAAVRERFADVLRYDDELDKKIEEAIENTRREESEAKEKVRQTFEEAHRRLEEEENRVMEELECACNESEEALQRSLKLLRETSEYSKILSEAGAQGNAWSRLMELNIVSEMNRQRKRMEDMHKAMMTDLKVVWDDKERKLSFTRTLINGAPVPNNISFPTTWNRGVEVSWECDLSGMSEGDKGDLRYVVEVKKGSEEERHWREAYSGAERNCSVSCLEKDTLYDVRVKCVVGGLHGRWGDVASVRTRNAPGFSECAWTEYPGNTCKNGKYFTDRKNPRVATNGPDGWCTVTGNTPLPPNWVTSWDVKVLKSKNSGEYIYVGVAPPDIGQSGDYDYGWYFNCYESSLWSGPPHNYRHKEYGPRKEDGEYVHTGESVGVVMDTTKGSLSFVVGGANLGVAYEGIPLDKPLVPCAFLYWEGDSVELVV